MDIDNLTIGDARRIAAFFGTSPEQQHPFVGKYVVCRCYSAGVHAGYLVSQRGDEVVLRDSRRLWSWKTRGGIALSGLAVHGLEAGKIDTVLPEIALTGVIETIPCSDSARESIHAAA